MNRTKKTLLSVLMLLLTTGASAFPFISPYAYCNNNPVNAIDPDGRDDYKLNEDGSLVFWRKTNAKTTDRIYSSDKNNNITINKTITKQLMTERDDYDGSYAVGGVELQDLFKFCADNSSVEWRLNNYKTSNGEKEVLMTSHDEDRVSAQNDIGGMNEKDLTFSVHSHCNEIDSNPSGFKNNESWIDKNGDLNMFKGDKSTAWKTSQRFEEQRMKTPRFYMYHTPTQTLVRYDKYRIVKRTKIKNGKLYF